MTGIYIHGAKRTAIGSMQGQFAELSAAQLGGVAIKAALEQAGVSAEQVDHLAFGTVISAGQGQAPARQALHAAGIPWSTPALTVNKMCGSGMQAVMNAADRLRLEPGVAVAGGMENMTQAPYLMPKGRQGMRLGHGKLLDAMFLDGLEDAYQPGTLMGVFADQTASARNLSRERQDQYALASLERAVKANQGEFAAEIAPVTVTSRKGETVFDKDESPFNAKPDKIPSLKPAFVKDGTVTAANASSISDGAAALVLGNQSEGALAHIVDYCSHAEKPEDFPVAPIGAISKLLARTGWTVEDVDLFEINEAFAVVPLAAMDAHNIPHDKINVNGGACALGHPIGASAARVIVTLIYALKARGLKRGVASVCIGGGEATAMAIELL